eukprot:Nitzschia sp. Nitz4//scaffold14_size191712//4847//5831//NITZ4_001698-RA/size191712-snap-gene-0.147-mRNA-1//-1//CDS//3329536852//3864//frame0
MTLWWVLVGLWCLSTVQAVPYYLLTSTRSKCFTVVAPMEQKLTINYHAPDLKLIDGEIDERALNAAANGPTSEDPVDGRDAQWNKRMKDKLERMQQKKMKDITITITQKSGLTGALASRQRTTYGEKGENRVEGQGKVREELNQPEGTISFLTGDTDGTVDICIQSLTANRNSPSRVALNIQMAGSLDPDQDNYDANNGPNLEHSDVRTQMTRLERDFQTLNARVKGIINSADFNKDQETAFHDQSVSMHSAAMYWPIIQLLVIIVTGITQANHIVSYMRTHHIGI